MDNKTTEHQFNVIDIFIKTGVDSLPSWVDKVWYREVLNKLKISILEHAQLRVSSDSIIPLGKARIPYLSREEFEEQARKRLHELVREFHPSITPVVNEYLLWLIE